MSGRSRNAIGLAAFALWLCGHSFQSLAGPVAVFTASPNPAPCGAQVTFDAGGSYADPGHAIVSYAWDFGGGQIGSGVVVTHPLTAPSFVVLTITDDSTPPQSAVTGLSVSMPPDFTPPVAAAGGPYATAVATAVTLDGSGSTDESTACGHTLGYEWFLTDGVHYLTPSSFEPRLTLDSSTVSSMGGAGAAYNVTLRVRDISGNQSSPSTTTLLIFAARAVVSGGGSVCEGNTGTITADLSGTPPWDLVWSDGFVQTGLTTSPSSRSVSPPPGTSTFSVTSVTGAGGVGYATGSAAVIVRSDTTAPVVAAPAPITVDQSTCCGTFGGGSATDDCDPAPLRLPPQVSGTDVTSATCFEAGTSAVTFRFRDGGGNTGTTDAMVTVRMFGDLNADAVADPSDIVILRAYLNGAAVPGTPPFTALPGSADLNHDAAVDPADLVVLRGYLIFLVGCLAP